MATHTYTIFDANPNTSGSCAWPSHDDVEIDADSDYEAEVFVRSVMEAEAAGLSTDDGYDVGDRLYAIVWDSDGVIVGEPTYEITADDIGVTEVSDVVAALANIADVHVDSADRAHITDYAPDSSEYDGNTEPGSAWDEECYRLLAEICAALPAGWSADWSDDAIVLTRDGAEVV